MTDHAIDHAQAREAALELRIAQLQRRCVEQAAEVRRLEAIASVCPIADFDLLTSLQAEKAHMQEHIAELEGEVVRWKQAFDTLSVQHRELGERLRAALGGEE